MIVVAGGSGTLGRRVVATLAANGQPVRALVRDTRRARDVLGPDVEVLAADVRDATAVAEATRDANVVISAVHGLLGKAGSGPGQVDHRGNVALAAAARRAGAGFVLVSVIGASADSPLGLSRSKYAAEQDLTRAGSDWVVVRATSFLETWVQELRSTVDGSGRPLVLGRGERPLPFVSADDVAAVVVCAATDPRLRGQVLEIGGPPMSMNQLAAAVQAADGRDAAARHLPRMVLRASAALAGPFNPAFARKSRAALVMDTVDLGNGDPGLRDRLGLSPATTADDVLARGAEL